jgi:hypothetical protein
LKIWTGWAVVYMYEHKGPTTDSEDTDDDTERILMKLTFF